MPRLLQLLRRPPARATLRFAEQPHFSRPEALPGARHLEHLWRKRRRRPQKGLENVQLAPFARQGTHSGGRRVLQAPTAGEGQGTAG